MKSYKFLIGFLIVAILCITVINTSGCSYLSPGVSKALSEEAQLKESKEQNRLLVYQTELLSEQNSHLVRIAVALEKLAEK